MLHLFRQRPGEIRIYLRRRPKADGGNPESNRLALAALATLLIAASALLFVVSPNPDRASVVSLSIVAAAFFFHILLQFEEIVFDERTRRIYRALFFLRVPLAAFDDIAEIRLRIQEEDGLILGRYVGVWKNNVMRRPLRLTVKGSSGQLNHFRHTVIPRVREMMFGPEKEGQAFVKGVTLAMVNPEDGGPPVPVEITRSGTVFPGRIRKSAGDSLRASFRLYRFLVLVVGLAIPALTAFLASRIVVADLLTFSAGLIGLLFGGFQFFLKMGLYVWSLRGAYRAVIRALRGNTTLLVDGKRRNIRFAIPFGLERQNFTFDSLIEITVKHRFGMRVVCLVLDDNIVDATVRVCFTASGAVRAIREIGAVMGVNPWQFFDLTSQQPQYTKAFRKRVMMVGNPYFEG